MAKRIYRKPCLRNCGAASTTGKASRVDSFAGLSYKSLDPLTNSRP
ncbi:MULTISPECIES: hypothetical protein [Phyllobacteriaceae]|nr:MULTISPECIES: hypothetical protein [Mesorhizobium]MBN9237476.1 hypothetical protein [Mesorhizobium sp.]MDQ0329003.1 hypothetical protein [Mesorhizobium sp. YL-MeA3-2017]